MNVGIVKFTIHIPGNRSLKGKRQVVNSLCQKLRNRFEVSVAQVDHLEHLTLATIGMSFVSNEGQIIQKIITDILAYLQQNSGNFVLGDFKQESLSGF